MDGCSRRQLLTIALVSAPALLAVRSAGAQTTKLSHEAAKYRATPNHGQKCAICVHFVAPNSCKLVQSPINPNGWCTLYTPKG